MHIYIVFTLIHVHRRKPGFSRLKTPTPNYSTYEGALGGTGTHTHTYTHELKSSCYFKFPEEDIHRYTLLLLYELLKVLFLNYQML